MFEISSFWKKLSAANTPSAQSKLQGWITVGPAVSGFVEPTLRAVNGSPEASKIFIIAAPGAVGKSTLAAVLSRELNYAYVDLAKTTPLGGNFFKGGLANAFGFDALPKAAAGEIGLIVDGLDEAQLRAAPAAYEAALIDLAEIVNNSSALPVILLGRTLAAEETAIILEIAGYESCTLEIQFFDDSQSQHYMEAKCQLLAGRSSEVSNSYKSHGQIYNNLASATRKKLTDVSGGDDRRFVGYAPVLDAICEFTLDPKETNPSARLSSLGGVNQVELLNSISNAILLREQGKLLTQIKAECPQSAVFSDDNLYTATEQRKRVLSKILGLPNPPLPQIPDAATRDAYSEMVGRFIDQHPFLDATNRGPTNLVFAADLFVWALFQDFEVDSVRGALIRDGRLLSGAFFDLYTSAMGSKPDRILPLSDTGLLYQALQSRMSARQRALIEVSTSDDDKNISVSFEVLDHDKPEAEDTFGPYQSNSESVLELRAPFSHVYIDAPVWVSLGDGISQQISAPTEIQCNVLTISARQLFVHGAREILPERQLIVLSANDVDSQNVQLITVNNTDFTVIWENSKTHPWTNYSGSTAPARSPELELMRRRLRKVLTAFRSHSKGSLVRFAKKLDGIRFTKGEIGENLLSILIEDGILSKTDGGKFYTLHQEIMSARLSIDYHALQQQKYTDGVDDYLESIIRR